MVESHAIRLQCQSIGVYEGTANAWLRNQSYRNAPFAADTAMGSLLRLTVALGVFVSSVPPIAGPAVGGQAGEGSIEVAVGGDLSLGNRMNAFIAQHGPAGVLADQVPELRKADLAIVNLESVVSDGGVQGVDTGEVAPIYFRARPEMLAVLSEAGIDAAVTANNHTGDYGPQALLEEHGYLDAMAVAHPGSGRDPTAACEPAYLSAGGLRIALFSVDTTQPRYAATADSAGTCSLDAADSSGWDRTYGPLIAQARERAHVVLFYVSWGPNFATAPTGQTRQLARQIVRLGVDAVIGVNAHRIQGIEIVDGRPVIYDAGTFLFDFPEPDDAVLWTLTLTERGVSRAAATPLVSDPGRTRAADPREADRIQSVLDERSSALGTELEHGGIDLRPDSRPGPTVVPPSMGPANGPAPAPRTDPPPDCVVETLPADVTPLDFPLGSLRLIGARIDPESLFGPAVVWAQTYWMADEPVDADYWLAPRAYPSGTGLTPWGDPHEPCDWRWPADRWRQGVIYVDRYPLRPADSILQLGGLPALAAGAFSEPLEIRVGAEVGSQLIGESSMVARVAISPSLLLQAALTGFAFATVLGLAAVFLVVRRRRVRRDEQRGRKQQPPSPRES